MIKLKDILLENGDWWDDSQSFDGKNKSKEQKKHDKQNYLDSITQLYSGKKIYIKFKYFFGTDLSRINNSLLKLNDEDRNKLESLYNKPIEFTLSKYKKTSFDDESDKYTFSCEAEMPCIEKKKSLFSTSSEIKTKPVLLDIYFTEYTPTGNTLQPINLVQMHGPVLSYTHDYRSWRDNIEYITKESAILLFNIAKKINPEFQPSMNSIGTWIGHKVLPIK